MTVIDKLPDGAFDGLRAELRGDALLALGRAEQAQAAYEQAREAGVAIRPAWMKLAEFATPARGIREA